MKNLLLVGVILSLLALVGCSQPDVVKSEDAPKGAATATMQQMAPPGQAKPAAVAPKATPQ